MSAKKKPAAIVKAPRKKSVPSPEKNTAKKALKATKAGRKKPAQKPESVEVVTIDEIAVTETGIIAKEAAILSIPFCEAINTTPLLHEVGRHAQFMWSQHIASHGGAVLSKALTDARIVIERGVISVQFSAQGTKLMRANVLKLMPRNAGLPVPVLVNSSGKIVEQGKVLGPLATGSRIAANVSIAVITTAHIISGADLAQKINKLDSKVEFLVAAHRIDQLARIEGIYCQARELLSMEQTDAIKAELHRLGRELFEIRSAWRREMAYYLGNLEKSEESKNWLVQRFQRLKRKGKDKKTAETVEARDPEIQLINGCLAIHIALAQAAGTLDTFLAVSLPMEIAELKNVRNQIKEKRHHILAKHSELRDSIDNACNNLANVIEIYEKMVIPRVTTRD